MLCRALEPRKRETHMKSIQFCLIVTLVVLAAAPLAASEDHLDEILAKMQNAARGIKTIHATMDQQTRHLDLGVKEVYSCDFKFKHGPKANDLVRLDYTRPAGQVVALTGDKIILSQASIKQVIITTRGSQAAQHQELAFIETPYKSIPELKSQYNISHVGDEQVNGAWASVLDLVPKTKSTVEKVKLWVDHGSALPVKYEVRSGTQLTSFTLTNLKTNEPMSDASFEVKWPKDWKVIKQ
jgi:outer membrane lipoprotein-sorting protein